jgi:hypothetical protein
MVLLLVLAAVLLVVGLNAWTRNIRGLTGLLQKWTDSLNAWTEREKAKKRKP